MELENICISAHHKYAPRALALIWLVLRADPLEHLPGGWCGPTEYLHLYRLQSLNSDPISRQRGREAPRSSRDYLHKLPIYAVFFRA